FASDAIAVHFNKVGIAKTEPEGSLMTPPIRNLERLSTKGGEATLITVCGDVIVGFLDRSNRFATHVASILRYVEWSSVRYELKRCAYKLRPLACPQLWSDFTVWNT